MVAHAFIRQKQVDLFEFETSVIYTQRKLIEYKYCKDLIYTIIHLMEESFLRLRIWLIW